MTNTSLITNRRAPAGSSMNKLQAERFANGLCVQCGSPALYTTQRCEPCQLIRRKENQEWRKRRAAAGILPIEQRRKQAGLCSKCGRPSDTGQAICSGCRVVMADYARTVKAAVWAERKAAGLCYRCGAPTIPGATVCAKHQAKIREAATKGGLALRQRRREAGQCISCRNPSLPGLTRCLVHHTWAALKGGKHGRNVPRSLAESVAAKFDGRCAYSGTPIQIGLDGHLEHIYPKSKRPDLALEVTNLVWAHAIPNRGKSDLEPMDPFLDVLFKPEIVARIRALAANVNMSSCTPPTAPIVPTP